MKKLCLQILVMSVVLFVSGCSGCSKSGRKQLASANEQRNVNVLEDKTFAKTVVKMRKESGVYYVPAKINGLEMDFIFDTGASTVSISKAEVIFLERQGKIEASDFVGKEKFMDASGNVNEGDIIVLKTVKIGDKTLRNIEATIVDNLNAPLLLGQTALAKFGKISIDYNKKQIIFEE